MNDLFREQALADRRQRLHGDIVLTGSFPLALLTALLLGLVALAAWGFMTLGFARKHVVAGRLEPAAGWQDVVADAPGVVLHAPVAEGQAVPAGATLLVLSAERRTARGDTQAEVDAQLARRAATLRQEQAQADARLALRRDALAARLAEARREAAQLEADTALQRRRSALAEESARAFESLHASRDVGPQLMRDKQDQALEQQARLGALQRQHSQLQAQIGQWQAEQAEAALAHGRDSQALQRELAALAQQGAEVEARRQWQLLAPRAGQVARLTVRPGDSVVAGQVLARLLPAGAALEAVLWLPGSAAGELRAGAPVQLRYAAYPFERYGSAAGSVAQVAAAPLPADEAQRLGADPAQPWYRVRVALARQDMAAPGGAAALPLRPGMPLQASLDTEVRRLYQWVLQPLAGAVRDSLR